MIEVEITDKMKKRAWRKSAQMGSLRGSITKGDGNIAGFLAELLVHEYLGGTIENTYDYDIVLDDGRTLDIKCKRSAAKPEQHYDCSITETSSKKQVCDIYVFVRIINVKGKWGKGYILGWLTKEEYLKKGVLWKVGDRDKSNGFLCKNNCINVKISELNPIETLKETL